MEHKWFAIMIIVCSFIIMSPVFVLGYFESQCEIELGKSGRLISDINNICR